MFKYNMNSQKQTQKPVGAEIDCSSMVIDAMHELHSIKDICEVIENLSSSIDIVNKFGLTDQVKACLNVDRGLEDLCGLPIDSITKEKALESFADALKSFITKIGDRIKNRNWRALDSMAVDIKKKITEPGGITRNGIKSDSDFDTIVDKDYKGPLIVDFPKFEQAMRFVKEKVFKVRSAWYNIFTDGKRGMTDEEFSKSIKEIDDFVTEVKTNIYYVGTEFSSIQRESVHFGYITEVLALMSDREFNGKVTNCIEALRHSVDDFVRMIKSDSSSTNVQGGVDTHQQQLARRLALALATIIKLNDTIFTSLTSTANTVVKALQSGVKKHESDDKSKVF